MSQQIKAIETQYKGYRFRSRLEARWAVFFDALGIRWEYEKEGYELPSGWYLPDFWLPDDKLWVEIKGVIPSSAEKLLARELSCYMSIPVFMFYGLPSENHGISFDNGDNLYLASSPYEYRYSGDMSESIANRLNGEVVHMCVMNIDTSPITPDGETLSAINVTFCTFDGHEISELMWIPEQSSRIEEFALACGASESWQDMMGRTLLAEIKIRDSSARSMPYLESSHARIGRLYHCYSNRLPDGYSRALDSDVLSEIPPSPQMDVPVIPVLPPDFGGCSEHEVSRELQEWNAGMADEIGCIEILQLVRDDGRKHPIVFADPEDVQGYCVDESRLILKAASIAKSSRFEYGQTPHVHRISHY